MARVTGGVREGIQSGALSEDKKKLANLIYFD